MLGRVEQALELSWNIFLENRRNFARRHCGFLCNFAPSVRFCLLGPPNASDGRPRKLRAARELSRTTASRRKAKRFGEKNKNQFVFARVGGFGAAFRRAMSM